MRTRQTFPWERTEAMCMPGSLGGRSISVGRQAVSEWVSEIKIFAIQNFNSVNSKA